MDKSLSGKAIVIDLQYLPCLEYFGCLLTSEKVFIEANEYYVKQSYRNRCYILTANKIDALTIPVKFGNKKILVKDIKIDYQQKWVNNHWRAIQSAYGKAPFFEFYAEYFEKLFYKNHQFLFDFNYELLVLCLKFLQESPKLAMTQTYNNVSENGIIDLRSVIHPKTEFNKQRYYKPVAYNQTFGSNFAGNLSILDLLFNEGNNAKNIIKSSTL